MYEIWIILIFFEKWIPYNERRGFIDNMELFYYLFSKVLATLKTADSLGLVNMESCKKEQRYSE